MLRDRLEHVDTELDCLKGDRGIGDVSLLFVVSTRRYSRGQADAGRRGCQERVNGGAPGMPAR